MNVRGKWVVEVQFTDSLRLGFSLKLPGFSLSVLPYLGGTDYLR